MKIGIIGAGYVGLSAGYDLAKKGHSVTIFEATETPGGLAGGFKDEDWEWALEAHYHHWFSNDSFVKNLAKEIGYPVSFVRPITSVLIKNEIHQLDSPLSLLRFPHLSPADRLRTGATLFFLKYLASWKYLEKVTTKDFVIKTMGENSWKVLWEPLMKGKFGDEAENISAAWFWARIKKRTPSLGYPDKGFEAFAKAIAKKIKKNKGKIYYKHKVSEVKQDKNKMTLVANKKGYTFDKVICTLPTFQMLKITKGLPEDYINSLGVYKGIGAVTLALALSEKFFGDGTYWLNVSQKGYPFLAVVEHTNLVPKSHYAGEHILYVGNYLPSDHKYFSYDAKQLVDEFAPYLKKINPEFSKRKVRKAWVNSAPFAQPIIPVKYSRDVPSHATPFPNLFLANIQQVYPWDRGTNYAVELGYRVADILLSS